MNTQMFIAAFHCNATREIIYATDLRESNGQRECYGYSVGGETSKDKGWAWYNITNWYQEQVVGSDQVLLLDIIPFPRGPD